MSLHINRSDAKSHSLGASEHDEMISETTSGVKWNKFKIRVQG